MAKTRKLLVEGNDDVFVVANLCMAHNLPDAFDIIDKKGISNLLETLHVELETSDLEILGILVDADTNPQSRWHTLRSILSKAGYTVPLQLVPEGMILLEQDKPKVGVWLMPDNIIPGILENFAASLVPDGDVLWPYALACVQHLPEQRFPEGLRAKADIHTWLAWQEEPGKPLGFAITAHYLNPQTELARGFINWLQALFLA